MAKQNVLLIFDVGKTNKKIFLFNEDYQLVSDQLQIFEEITDEDGFPCEDINALTNWIKKTFTKITQDKKFEIKAVNFSAYGASFVYVDNHGNVIAPLYNYLKSFPEKISSKFYNTYGGESLISKQTASPVLGSLNSGLQLYRIKYEKPEVFKQIAFALHLPQYLSYILTDYPATDITSIGCHTNLWNFNKQKYHRWVNEENIESCFAPILPCTYYIPFGYENKNYVCGFGLHDSSSALIPYLIAFTEPFILISTGTWCISLNPFNHSILTDYELYHDCLCYLNYLGKPVKASRLFTGYEHEQQVMRLAEHFHTSPDYYKTVKYNPDLLKSSEELNVLQTEEENTSIIQQSSFAKRSLHNFENYEEAYHQLIFDIIIQQKRSTKIILHNSPVKRIFVDGGFSQNSVYMNLLATAFPYIDVFAANIPQASTLGAALAIHEHWNKNLFTDNLIDLKEYKATRNISL